MTPREWADELMIEVGTPDMLPRDHETMERIITAAVEEERERWVDIHDKHVQQVEVENAKLRAAMEKVEWVERVCPWCFWCDEGHKPDCARQLALGICNKPDGGTK